MAKLYDETLEFHQLTTLLINKLFENFDKK